KSALNANVTNRLAIGLRVHTATRVDNAYRMANPNVRTGMSSRNFGFHNPDRRPNTNHVLPIAAVAKMNMNDSQPMDLKKRSIGRVIGFASIRSTDPLRSMFGMKKEVTMTPRTMAIPAPMPFTRLFMMK